MGSIPGDVVMMRVFLVAPPGQARMDFAGMMTAYREFFGTEAQPMRPARSTMQVAGLVDPGWLVEIEVTAATPSRRSGGPEPRERAMTKAWLPPAAPPLVRAGRRRARADARLPRGRELARPAKPPAAPPRKRSSRISCCTAARPSATGARGVVRDGESWLLELVGRAGERRIRFEPPDREIGDPIFALSPHLVREGDGAVTVGLLASRRTGYSGGGALATRLILVRAEPGAAQAAAVLTVPVEGSAMVRACFSEDDMRLRRQACHDDYQFSGTLTLAPGGEGGHPPFLLATRARTYPGDVTRWEDSDERPPLRRGDLVWAEHSGCSYRRTFAFNSTAGRYVADAPLPDCGQFLVGEVALTEEANPAAE